MEQIPPDQGRAPAALNNIVGLKPTLGALSATGVVPACRYGVYFRPDNG
ncbi:amidase family protein [Roseobacter sp. OBYS 0001]|nr:amidase family protein [Roseobacter sp. OBYS 0001]